MTEFDKLRVVITLKKLSIHSKFYDFAAYLRDLEKLEFQNILVSIENCVPQNITISDYYYMIILIDRFDENSLRKYRSSCPTVKSEIEKLVQNTFIDLIRQIKIQSIID